MCSWSLKPGVRQRRVAAPPRMIGHGPTGGQSVSILGYRGWTASCAFRLAEPALYGWRQEGSAGVQTITLEAISPESGSALFRALSAFLPEWDMNDEGRCLVSVRFVSEAQVVEVLDTIQQHLAEREERPVKSMTVALDDAGPSPRGHGRPMLRVVRDEVVDGEPE